MQAKLFIDTNIFIYSVYEIDLPKREACIKLLNKALKGEIKLWTTEWVIAELVWFMLRNKTSWLDVKNFLIKGIFTSKGIEVRGKSWLLPVISSCDKGESFVDAINHNIINEENINLGYSYDKDLDKWRNFKRLEPK